MPAEPDLSPDELLAADALFAELLGEREEEVADLALRRVLGRFDEADAGPLAEAG